MSGRAPVRGLVVVIPARDEESLIPSCLAAVNESARILAVTHPRVTSVVVVAADRCSDGTVAVARACAAPVVVAVDAGSVGIARGHGVSAGVAVLSEVPPDQLWIASTDADTRVPPDWLTHQVDLADSGVGLVVGRAVPDRRELDEPLWRRWHEHHTSADPAAHVHGANLGFRYDAYCAVGGWPPLAEHEDRILVDALSATGVQVGAGLEVTTSGRLVGRSPGGYSGFLRQLAIDADAV